MDGPINDSGVAAPPDIESSSDELLHDFRALRVEHDHTDRELNEHSDGILQPSSQSTGPLGQTDASSSPAIQHTLTTSEHNPNGLLRLVNRPSAAVQQERRARRFSDTDRDGNPSVVRNADFALTGNRVGSTLPSLSAAHLHNSPFEPQEEQCASQSPAPRSSTPLEPHVCDAARCAVSNALGTTELLEYILTWMETRDILNLLRVNQTWNTIIKSSPQLRLHLFAAPQFRKPSVEFELLPLSLSGLSITLGPPLCQGRWIEVAMTREAAAKIRGDEGATRRRPRARSIFEGLRGGLGSNRAGPSNKPWPATALQKTSSNTTIEHKDLYITQPPICAMQGFVYEQANLLDSVHGSNDSNDEAEQSARAKLSCDSGVTLGFLAGIGLSILPAPSASGRASLKEFEEARKGKKGDKKAVFKAIMSFTDEHTREKKRIGSEAVILLGPKVGD